MLLDYHEKYSSAVIDALNVDRAIKEQVKIGAIANDLCEFTNEGYLFLRSKDAIYSLLGFKEKVFGNTAIYQSHFGRLTSLHAMSKEPGEPASTTKRELVAWFDFLNDVALERITIVPNKKITSDPVQIRDMFRGGSIEYDQIFDADENLKIKYRALGMMLHLIQDAFTFSHCERNDNNEVVKFYCYKLQDKAKHKSGDDVPNAQREMLLRQCENCVQSLLQGDRYEYHRILLLSSDAQKSDGGNFRGTGKGNA
jgi:hypothetical protein